MAWNGPVTLGGAAGRDGAPGREGEPGEDGQSVPGTPGAAGTPGTAGATGGMGPPGMAGETAEDPVFLPGPQGLQGIQGIPGQSGPPGFVEDAESPTFIPGVLGLQGVQGIQGIAGPPGIPEEPESPVFLPGVVGATGAQGLSIQGPPGLDGESFHDDIPPIPGRVGDPGAVGIQGAPGPPGLAEDAEAPSFIPAVQGPAGKNALNNLLANSGGWFFQRQAPATLTTTADDTYAADRWVTLTQTATIQMNRTTGSVSPYAIKLTQNNGAQRVGLLQIVENAETYPYTQGATVRFQFKAKCSLSTNIRYAIVEWQGTADTVTSDIVNTWTSTTYTASNFFIASTVVAGMDIGAAGTGWTTFQVSGTPSSSCTNLIVFIWTDGTFALNATLEVSELVLCDASQSQGWLPEPMSVELARCQRYYEKSYAIELAPATATTSPGLASTYTGASWANNSVSGSITFAVRKRATPTMTIRPFTTPANTNRVSDVNGVDQVANSGSPADVNDGSFCVQNLSGGAIVPGGNVIIYHYEANAEL